MTNKDAPEVTVRGHSDDILNITGGGLYEEFYPGDKESYYVGFSDGTLLRVRWDEEGCWEIRPLVQGPQFVKHTPYSDPDTDHSDEVTLGGPMAWVVGGKDFQRGKAPA